MILNRCIEAEFSTYALKSGHVGFLECDMEPPRRRLMLLRLAASSRAAAPSPTVPAGSSLTSVSQHLAAHCRGHRSSELQR